MRRLADDLGVAPMSLYSHVRGREDLLDGLSEAMVDQIGVSSDLGDSSPRTVLRRFAHGIRAVARAHPAAFQLVGMRPLHTRAALVPVETALSALGRLGLGEDEAVHAYRALVSYARGFALAEIAGFTLEGRTAPAESGELPASEFPTVARLRAQLVSAPGDAAFEFGLEAILVGIETRAPVAARPRGARTRRRQAGATNA